VSYDEGRSESRRQDKLKTLRVTSNDRRGTEAHVSRGECKKRGSGKDIRKKIREIEEGRTTVCQV